MGWGADVQSVLGGAAHLLNFDGSDTMSAAYHVQYHLNKGTPVPDPAPPALALLRQRCTALTAVPSRERMP